MGTHNNQRLAPWSDWKSILHNQLTFFTNAGVNILTAASFAADQLDVTAGGDVSGGATPKHTMQRPAGASAGEEGAIRGWWHHIKVPDFVISRDQPGRLASWSGLNTEAMGDGGRRVALQVENVFSSRSPTDAIGADLTGFAASLKPKGFGGQLIAETAGIAVGTDMEDAIIAPNFLAAADIAAGTFGAFGAAAATAFPHLALPSDDDGSGGLNLVPTFGDNGVCRIQTVFEVPATITPGAYLELMCAIWIPIEVAGVAVQWQYAAYRWLRGGPEATYPLQAVNESFQLQGDGTTDEEPEQPYLVAGSLEP